MQVDCIYIVGRLGKGERILRDGRYRMVIAKRRMHKKHKTNVRKKIPISHP